MTRSWFYFLLAVLLFLLVACLDVTGTITVDIRTPYCPVSDSAKAAADSIPAVCRDSLPR